MQYLLVHPPCEAKIGGLQQYRWTYNIERALKKLRTMVGNKARVEDCITVKEIAYFISVYFIEHHNINAPTMQCHMNEDIPCSDLQIL
jgi:hypothetical protein